MSTNLPRWPLAALVVACASLAGCARLTSIHRVTPIPDGETSVITIDAKQRAILASSPKTTVTQANGKTTTTTELRRFCAEPPPDALTALATSIAAEASVSGASSENAALKFANSLSENAATIERTQTVNILREAMYRNCERYLSGAIDADEFIVQAARDQQMIIQVLAIEQLTGAARAQATALTTVAKAAGSGPTEATILALDAARKDKLAKQAAATKALTEANAKEPTDKSCDGAPHTIPDGTAEADAAKLKAKNEACATAKTAAAAAKEASDHHAALQAAVARQSAVSVEASGQLEAEALKANNVSADVARAVVQITQQSHVLDEIVLACMVQVRKGLQSDPKKRLDDFCASTLGRMQEVRAQQLLGLAQPSDPRISAALSLLAEPPSLSPLLLASLGKVDDKDRSQALTDLFDRAGVKRLATARSKSLLDAVAKASADGVETALYSLTPDERKRLASILSQ